MKTYIPHIPKDFLYHSQKDILSNDGELVSSFYELQIKAAQLAFFNPYVLLFFRGQNFDYKKGTPRRSTTTILPSLYRKNSSITDIKVKWDRLIRAEKLLAKELLNSGYKLAARKRLILWSIIQHYEVTETPLLDITQSLYVACSFAVMNSVKEYAYVYVLGLPYITNRITVNSEEYITNIRLISIAPPEAQRPYLQEGYLAGEDEIKEPKTLQSSEFDFSRRLIYKFRIKVEDFKKESAIINTDKLLPPLESDQIAKICAVVKERMYVPTIKANVQSLILKYMDTWHQIEQLLVENFETRDNAGRYNILVAIRNITDSNLSSIINSIRLRCNDVVHNQNKNELNEADITTIEQALKKLKTYIEMRAQP